MALEDTAVKLIAKFGRTASLLRRAAVPDDTNAPWDATASEGVSESITAVFVGFKDDQIDGQTIQSGDQMALIAAKATTGLGTEDSIVDGGRTWRIIAAELIKPGSVEYLWKCQVRA